MNWHRMQAHPLDCSLDASAAARNGGGGKGVYYGGGAGGASVLGGSVLGGSILGGGARSSLVSSSDNEGEGDGRSGGGGGGGMHSLASSGAPGSIAGSSLSKQSKSTWASLRSKWVARAVAACAATHAIHSSTHPWLGASRVQHVWTVCQDEAGNRSANSAAWCCLATQPGSAQALMEWPPRVLRQYCSTACQAPSDRVSPYLSIMAW